MAPLPARFVTTLGGTRAGFGRAGAANPVTVPTAEVAANVTAALAAGTGGPAGSVLISGTGAIAAEIHGARIVRTAEGRTR